MAKQAHAISLAEVKRLADLASARNMECEIERAGTIIRVRPLPVVHHIDGAEESALDKELAEFDRKNGYN